MKIAAIAACALVLPGCALFQGSSDRTAAVRPAAESDAPARIVREPFRPAFGVGQPVALIPCKGAARLSGGCRALGTWHEVSGGVPDIPETRTLREASAEADE